MSIKVTEASGCPSCPFGKATTDPWKKEIYFVCYAHLFQTGGEELKVTSLGAPDECPLRKGPVIVELAVD